MLSPGEAIDLFLASLKRPARLLVAISGGSDSTGLLTALCEAAGDPDESGITILAATIDHQLRPESADEALAVNLLCDQFSVEHRIQAWTGEKPETGRASAARIARYQLLCQIAEELQATAIVTGHTLDDQIETITMRQARDPERREPEGTAPREGRSGDAGMSSSVLINGRFWLFRPFLKTRRNAIRDFLLRRGMGWIDDPSNTDERSERVRVRLALAGLSDAKADAWRTAVDLAQNRRRSVSEAAAGLLRQSATVWQASAARLDARALSAPPEVLFYAIGTLIAVLGGREHLPASEPFDRIMSRYLRGESFRETLGRVLLYNKDDGLYLARESRDLPEMQVSMWQRELWDGRFEIVSHVPAACTVMPGQGDVATGSYPDVPTLIARAAWRSLPHVIVPQEFKDVQVQITPVLAPFRQFLADFDLGLADCLAQLMGLTTIPRPPLNDLIRKT
ncbi:tRNA lysidine(34) synthetase TilS [Rhizobium rhizoryzae]|uniref:tRNA lysidine(34) synthetase TilS n=1 Tax=Rhizobium rhizoryzae TaxID=451876 RepID=UPI002899B63B|nr:tRNA lysidine(34) synthetase TilS [Rhizobium rhizoryzae]